MPYRRQPSLASGRVVTELQDPQPGQGGQTPVIGEVGSAPGAKRRGQLERIGCPDVSGRTKLGGAPEEGPVQVYEVKAPAPGEQRLVPSCESRVSGSIRCYQDLQQRDRGGDPGPSSGTEEASLGEDRSTR